MLALLLVVGLAGCATADVQYLDPAFGTGGMVITDLGGSGASALLLQADGKLVVVGWKSKALFFYDLALLRYNPDGSLDPTFGSEGIILVEIGDSFQPSSAAVLPDGKILVFGTTIRDKTIRNFALARFNPDGSRDSTFGRDGQVITYLEGRDNASGMAIQTNGKIIVLGNIPRADGYLPTKAVLLRYNADGSRDPTFGNNGQATIILRWSHGAEAIALQADDKILVIGALLDPTNRPDFALLRYNSNGTIDSTFGNDGMAISDFGDSDTPEAMLVQPNGKILVVGYAWSNYPSHTYATIAIIRYNTDGSLDSTFGNQGIANHDFGFPGQSNALALQADGNIVVAGRTYSQRVPYMRLITTRCNPDGSLDSNFAGNGKPVTAPGGEVWVTAAAIQPDGKIVVAGSGEPRPPALQPGDFVPIRNGSGDIMLVRYSP